MKNEIITSINSNLDFVQFIDSKFDKPIKDFKFPADYKSRRAPDSFLENSDPVIAQDIKKRERIRDNIYIEYNFDIFKFPIAVFFENGDDKEKLIPFKYIHEAEKYCDSLKVQGVFSLLIFIMNYPLTCKIYK